VLPWSPHRKIRLATAWSDYTIFAMFFKTGRFERGMLENPRDRSIPKIVPVSAPVAAGILIGWRNGAVSG
jgi:hypothetical protein